MKAAPENKGTPVPGQKAQPEATSDCLLVVLGKERKKKISKLYFIS